jgi:hypothetical protein
MWEPLIELAAALLPGLALALAGIFVGVWKPKREHHNSWRLGLIITGVLSFLLIWYQQHLAHVARETESKALNNHFNELVRRGDTLQTRLDGLDGKLTTISRQNASLNDALNQLGEAAHIPSGRSVDDLVRGIIEQLPKQSVRIGGHDNVTSIGSNGQTAKTIINNSKPPEWKVVENRNAVQDGDSYKYESIIEVVADSPPNNILFSAHGPFVMGLDVKPLTMGIVNHREGTQNGGYVYLIDQPIGRFLLTVKTTDASMKPNVDISFNVRIADNTPR